MNLKTRVVRAGAPGELKAIPYRIKVCLPEE